MKTLKLMMVLVIGMVMFQSCVITTEESVSDKIDSFTLDEACEYGRDEYLFEIEKQYESLQLRKLYYNFMDSAIVAKGYNKHNMTLLDISDFKINVDLNTNQIIYIDDVIEMKMIKSVVNNNMSDEEKIKIVEDLESLCRWYSKGYEYRLKEEIRNYEDNQRIKNKLSKI